MVIRLIIISDMRNVFLAFLLSSCRFVQILVQEMGFTVDLDFVIELATLFDSLGREVPKVQ